MLKRVLSLMAILFVGLALAVSQDSEVPVAFHQKFIEGNKQEPKEVALEIGDPDKVFQFVFSALDPEVIVYPTENYYYFIFKANGKEFWGNIRLAVNERDLGILNFVYWEFDPQYDSLAQPLTFYKKYGADNGVIIKKLADFRYSVSYAGKEVIFNLNQIDQAAPKIAKLEDGEVLVQKTFDESGFGLLLIFNKIDPHFMFVLDEERPVPERLINFNEDLVIGEKSHYAFYVDKKNNRKILIGADMKNVGVNNYYDGPFDQLADNYVKGPEFKNYVEATYPDLRGKIDNYGQYLGVEDARIAITPYYVYSSAEWLYDIIERCGGAYSGSKFYACISHDSKEVF